MSNALTPVPAAPIPVRDGALQPTNLSELVTLANVMARSGMVPKDYANRPDAIIVALQLGGEVGLSPMAALQNIAVINGRPSIWGDALIGLARAHPECEDIIETLSEDGDTATCTVKRRGCTPVVRSFSVDDAKTAKLWGKAGPWMTYPKRMLQMRARGFAVRDAFADALRGLSCAEESADLPTAVQPLVESDFAELAPAPDPEPEAPAEAPPELLQALVLAVDEAGVHDAVVKLCGPIGAAWTENKAKILDMVDEAAEA